MQTEIRENLHNPAQLEKLYRADKEAFKKAFNLLYPSLPPQPVLDFWNARLNFKTTQSVLGMTEIFPLLLAVFMAGLLAQIPMFFHLDEPMFYQRNAGFIVFPFLMAYFFHKNKTPFKRILLLSFILLVSVIYINLLPQRGPGDTLTLAAVHLFPVLWFLWLCSFKAENENSSTARTKFIIFNGNVLVMGVLLGISGAALTGITFGLFALIGIDIEKFYLNMVLPFGLTAVPLFAVFLADKLPRLVGKVAPVIAKIFSPLVLLMLSIYLIALMFFTQEPFDNRDFLLMFNLLLIGVMALIFFTILHSPKNEYHRWYYLIISALATVTLAVNGLALSAIISRLMEGGLTPNRLAVTGSNVLMLIHLALIAWRLFNRWKSDNAVREATKTLVGFLPVYLIWALIVVYAFPVVFGFR